MRIARLLLGVALTLCLLAIPATAAARDRNHDRIPDRWEKRHGLSLKVKQAKRDQDRDGLVNKGEFRARTNPRDADTDNDGVEDADEDRDRDGVDNGNEVRERTHPSDRDTDNDGKSDAREDADKDDLKNVAEDRTGNDPIDKDTDDDGVEDGDENAGMVVAFDESTGKLIVSLNGGGTIEGNVTDSTVISCETEDEHENDIVLNDPIRTIQSSNEEEGEDEAEGEGEHNQEDDGERNQNEGGEDDDGEDDDGPNELDEDEERGDEDDKCSTADLVEDAVVHEAELKLTGAGAVFKEIELVK